MSEITLKLRDFYSKRGTTGWWQEIRGLSPYKQSNAIHQALRDGLISKDAAQKWIADLKAEFPE